MTCSRAGIIFNEEKFCFGRQQLEYLRYHLGKDSVEPSEDMLARTKEPDAISPPQKPRRR